MITLGTDMVFVSPHLDDAVLSSGGLMFFFKKKKNIKVVNVFTKGSEPPEIFFNKRSLLRAGFDDSDSYFKQRKKEDKAVLAGIGVKPINLDFVDAAWRKKKTFRQNRLTNFIPEINHLYPTKFHYLSGTVDKEDEILMPGITTALKKIIKKDAVVFCPLAIGGHVDHLIVRNICQENFSSVVYWSDYPYNLMKNPDKKFIIRNNLKKSVWTKSLENKEALINGYETQKRLLFKHHPIKIVPEEYYYHA